MTAVNLRIGLAVVTLGLWACAHAPEHAPQHVSQGEVSEPHGSPPADPAGGPSPGHGADEPRWETDDDAGASAESTFESHPPTPADAPERPAKAVAPPPPEIYGTTGTSGHSSPSPKGAAPRDGARDIAPLARKKVPGRAGGGSGGAHPVREDSRAAAKSPSPHRALPSAPSIKAGRHDDNTQYNRFLSFLEDNRVYIPYPVDVAERLVIQALDPSDRSLHNCDVQVKRLDGTVLSRTTTYADGTTHFFPRDAGGDDKEYAVRVDCQGAVRNGQLTRNGKRRTEVRFTKNRQVPPRVPVDIAIVIDTTGSMGGQIARLKHTLQAIHFQLTQLPSAPDIRFGLVAYRDRGDAYVTQVSGFTSDVQHFQQTVDALDADGGGDTPEDLQAGLEKAMHELSWRPDAVRLGFVVADAIPHTDYGQTYTYAHAMRESLGRGIKWTMVGAGGLPRDGEVIFRQIAQYTMGEYVFVTQSGGGDHEGGTGEASHHVGTNYKTENLDQAIVRIVRRELSYLTNDPKDFDTTIVVTAPKTAPRERVLSDAVGEVMRQLHDYASLRIAAGTPVAVVPVVSTKREHDELCEALTDELTLAASRNASLRVVERDLRAVAQEIKVQLSELFDAENSVRIGNMVGAELLIVGKLTPRPDGLDLFAKLVRVETGEVLSVAKASLSGGAFTDT